MSDTPTQTTRIDEDVQTHVSRALQFESPPETFAEFWTQLFETVADELGREMTLDDLCTTDDSPHWARVDGQTQSYQCVTDAFILATVLDDPVTVRTESPVSGTELVVEFDEDGVVDAPEGAHLSFGVERSVTPPDGQLTPEKMYGRFCPYSKAFASREEFDQWAADHPDVAATVQPLDEALDLKAKILPSVEEFAPESTQGTGCGDACGCGGEP